MLPNSAIDQVVIQLNRLYEDVSKSLSFSTFYNNLSRLYNLITRHYLIAPITEYAQSQSIIELEKVMKEVFNHGMVEYTNEVEMVPIYIETLKRIQQKPNYESLSIGMMLVLNLPTNTNSTPIYAEAFAQAYVKPLLDYIIDHLTSNYVILSLLLRYQKKCEWFRQRELYELAQQGELALNNDLYEYLFDSNLDIQIEPKSTSGRVDFMTSQASNEPIVADGKIFTGKKTSILHGVYQLYRYAIDHQRKDGYLIIYNTSDSELTFDTSHEIMGVPYISIHHKNLYFVIVNIRPNRPSASKSGLFKTVQITEDELIKVIEDTGKSSPAEPGLDR